VGFGLNSIRTKSSYSLSFISLMSYLQAETNKDRHHKRRRESLVGLITRVDCKENVRHPVRHLECSSININKFQFHFYNRGAYSSIGSDHSMSRSAGSSSGSTKRLIFWMSSRVFHRGERPPWHANMSPYAVEITAASGIV
jgi:hypothetical protein